MSVSVWRTWTVSCLLLVTGEALAEPVIRHVPREILALSDSFVISRLGRRYFDSNIALESAKRLIDPASSDSVSSYFYRVRYSALNPGRPYATFDLEIDLDESGEVIDFYGVPNCVDDSTECRFDVDEDRARAIAMRFGLEPGLEPWHFRFKWDIEEETFIWEVSNLLGRSEYGSSSGRTIRIDGNDGRVYSMKDYMLVP